MVQDEWPGHLSHVSIPILANNRRTRRRRNHKHTGKAYSGQGSPIFIICVTRVVDQLKMSKSKRAKVGTCFPLFVHFPNPLTHPVGVVHLTKTEKKGRENKSKLMEQVREAAATYQHTFLFRVHNMRNTLFKALRMALPGRFFIGKNRVMALALGLDEASECSPNMSHMARRLRGDLGLLFTNESPECVQLALAEIQEEDYARTGNKARTSVVIEAAPAGLCNVDTNEPLPATVEPQLRAAGMPTKLRGGTVLLAADSYEVCQEGKVLTADQTRILKVFGIKMATFGVVLLAHHQQDGTFEEYEVDDEEKATSSEGPETVSKELPGN